MYYLLCICITYHIISCYILLDSINCMHLLFDLRKRDNLGRKVKCAFASMILHECFKSILECHLFAMKSHKCSAEMLIYLSNLK